jgi:hypothetical protein
MAAGRSSRVRVYFDGDTSGLSRATSTASRDVSKLTQSYRQQVRELGSANASFQQAARHMGVTASEARKLAQANQQLGHSTQQATSHQQRFGTVTGTTGMKLKDAAKSAALAATAYIGISQATAAIDTTENLARATLVLHHNLGLSAKTAGAFAGEAKARDVDYQRLTMATKGYSNAVELAKQGSASQAGAFKTLGLSMKELKSANPDKLLFDIADGAKAMNNTTAGTRALGLIFGRTFGPLAPLLRSGSEGMKQFFDQINQAGANVAQSGGIKKAQDIISAWRQAKRESLGLQVAFTENLQPALIKVLHAFGDVTRAVRTMSKPVRIALAVSTGAIGLLLFLGKLAKAWNAIRDAAGLAAAAEKVAGSSGGPGGIAGGVGRGGGAASTASKLAPAAGLGLAGSAGIAGVGVGGAVALAFAVGKLTKTEQQLEQASHSVGRSISVVNGDFAKHKQMLESVVGSYKKFEDMATSKLGVVAGVTQKAMDKVHRAMDKGPEAGQQALANHFQKMVSNIQDAMDKGSVSVKKGTDYINTVLKQEFAALGIPDLFMTQQQAQAQHQGTLARQGKPHKKGAQQGGHIPGPSRGDTVPLWAEGGEFMVNAKATKRFLPLLKALNDAVPRFAGGGQLPLWSGHGAFGAMTAGALDMESAAAASILAKAKPRGVAAHGSVGGHPELQPGISAIAATVLKRFPGMSIGSTLRPGDPGFHGQGRAADLVGGNMDIEGAWIAKHMTPQLTEGIHNPTLSVDTGHHVPSSFWGPATWADHVDHIHLAKQRGGIIPGFAAGGIVPPKHGAHWIHANTPSHWTADEAATLLWQAGLSEHDAGILSRVVPNESGGDPRAHNPSGATGLFQILGAVVPGNLYDPRINALNAAKKFIDAGHSLGPWEGAPSGPTGHILRARVGGASGGAPGAGTGTGTSFPASPQASGSLGLIFGKKQKGKGTKGYKGSGQLGGTVPSLPDAGDSGTSTDDALQAQNDRLQQIVDLLSEQNLTQQQTITLLNTQSGPNGVIANALAALINGQIGGKVGIGFSSPSWSGGMARY